MQTPMILTSLLCLAALSAPSSAATLRVPSDYPTIQGAVDAAAPGDVVLVSAGTYAPFLIASKNDITVRGDGRAVILAAGSESGIGVGLALGIRLEKLTVRNADEHGISVFLGEVSVTRCKIEGAGRNGILLITAAGSRLHNNRIQDTGEDGIHVRSGNVTLTKNRITRTGGSGAVVLGDGCTLTQNEVSVCGAYGLQVGEVSQIVTGSLVQKNQVSRARDGGIMLLGGGHSNSVLGNQVSRLDHTALFIGVPATWLDRNRATRVGRGIYISQWDCVVTKNLIKRASDDGLCLFDFAVRTQVERNRIRKSGSDGIEVFSADNRFVRNLALQSGDYDLNDHLGAGSNTYIDNTFGSTSP